MRKKITLICLLLIAALLVVGCTGPVSVITDVTFRFQESMSAGGALALAGTLLLLSLFLGY